MKTPKWFDYSSLCYDELAVINRAANSPLYLPNQEPRRKTPYRRPMLYNR